MGLRVQGGAYNCTQTLECPMERRRNGRPRGLARALKDAASLYLAPLIDAMPVLAETAL